MFRHVEPFLRYLRSKGRVSDSNGKVSMVEPREYQPDQFFFLFSNSSFCRIFSFCPISVLYDLHINLSSAPHTQPHHTKLWGNVRHIPTHPPAPPWCILRLGFSTKNHLFTQHTLFFVPSRHWNWCFDGSGRVFRAVFACAGPPQSPLHTCTTTLLSLLSFFVCVQSSGRYSSTPFFWVDAARAQNKVRNQVFLPCLHCPPLAPIHPYCLSPLLLILSHIKPCVFLVCTLTLPFLYRFLAGKEQFLSLSCWCLALCFM